MSLAFKCRYCGLEDDPGNEWGEYGIQAERYSCNEYTLYDDKDIPVGRVRYYVHPGTTFGEDHCRTEVRIYPEIDFKIGEVPPGLRYLLDNSEGLWSK